MRDSVFGPNREGRVAHGGSFRSKEILFERRFGARVTRRMTLYINGRGGCSVSHDRRRSIVNGSVGV